MSRLALLFLTCVSSALYALEPWQQLVDVARFRRIAERAAPRVDLFDAIWRKDPGARLYGGSSRDFLWFVRKQLSRCTDEGCVDRVEQELSTRVIDAKEFVVGESDVDVVAEREEIVVDYDSSHFQRIETIRAGWLRPGSTEYDQELRQGGLPVEKILLGIRGFEDHPVPSYRGGLEEIWRGVPTLVYDPRIESTPMYESGGNHPLLIALRYIRQAAVAYGQRYGKGAVNLAQLESVLDGGAMEAVAEIFRKIRSHPNALDRFFAEGAFRKRLNRQLRRIFRSYVNPNASQELFRRFGVDEVFELFEGKGIEPYHTVIYSKMWDEEAVRRARAANPRMAARLFTVREWAARNGLALEKTEDGEVLALYHGTRTIAAYRSIVLYGILPSPDGSAGEGPYAVDLRSLAFAENWSRGHEDSIRIGSPLVVKLRVRADATILDVHDVSVVDETRLADELGADVVRYDLDPTHAYVVKNGAAIARAVGHSIPVMPLPEAKLFFDAHAHEPDVLRRQLTVDPWLSRKLTYLLPTWTHDELIEHFGEFMGDPMELWIDVVRRAGQGEVSRDRMERIFERFLWEPLRLGRFVRAESAWSYGETTRMLGTAQPLVGEGFFRRMLEKSALAEGPTAKVVGDSFALALVHSSFEPNWAARYAHHLLQKPEAYAAEVAALAKSWNPVLALAFQGMAWDEARRNRLPLPAYVPVAVTVDDWTHRAMYSTTVHSIVLPAALCVAAHAETAPELAETLGRAMERLHSPGSPFRDPHAFESDVSSALAPPFFREWGLSQWALFLKVAPWIDVARDAWLATRWPDDIALPPAPAAAVIDRFFRALAPVHSKLEGFRRQRLLDRMLEAWVSEPRRSGYREALATGVCPAALAAAD